VLAIGLEAADGTLEGARHVAALGIAVRGAHWLGDVPSLRQIGERLEAVAIASPVARAQRLGFRARAASHDEDPALALPLFAEEIGILDSIGNHFAAAKTRLDLVAAFGKERPEAREAADQARTFFESARARVYLDRLDDALEPAPPDSARVRRMTGVRSAVD
jgi:hypothetical protein